jgi:hypothetical protein
MIKFKEKPDKLKFNTIKYFIKKYVLKNILHKEISDKEHFENLKIQLNNIFNGVSLIKYEIIDDKISLTISFNDDGKEKEIVVIKSNAHLEN